MRQYDFQNLHLSKLGHLVTFIILFGVCERVMISARLYFLVFNNTIQASIDDKFYIDNKQIIIYP